MESVAHFSMDVRNMSELFKTEHKVLVCLSVISKELGEIKRIEKATFKERIRQLYMEIFKGECVFERELEYYFSKWMEQGLIYEQSMPGDKRKTFYIINPNKVRTENVTVIELPENELIIHDSIAGILIEGSWARRYKL